MKVIIRRFSVLSILILSFLCAMAVHDNAVSPDIDSLLKKMTELKLNRIGKIARLAELLEGTPGVSFRQSFASNTRPMDFSGGLDSREFVEAIMAVVLASENENPDKNAFLRELEKVRYRTGTDNGYASRLLYGADWIIDNSYRGNIREYTNDFETNTFQIKTLDYISSHRDEFAGLKDSVAFERMKAIEMGYRAHKIPFLKVPTAGKKDIIEAMQSGDIIMILGKQPGMDINDMGIILIKEGKPRLMHVNTMTNKWTLEQPTLVELLKHNTKSIQGYRIMRISE